MEVQTFTTDRGPPTLAMSHVHCGLSVILFATHTLNIHSGNQTRQRNISIYRGISHVNLYSQVISHCHVWLREGSKKVLLALHPHLISMIHWLNSIFLLVDIPIVTDYIVQLSPPKNRHNTDIRIKCDIWLYDHCNIFQAFNFFWFSMDILSVILDHLSAGRMSGRCPVLRHPHADGWRGMLGISITRFLKSTFCVCFMLIPGGFNTQS